MGGCTSSQVTVGAYVDGSGDVHFEVCGRDGDQVKFEFRRKPTGGGWTKVSAVGGWSSLPSEYRSGIWRTKGGWAKGSYKYDVHVTINGNTVITDEKKALECGSLSKQLDVDYVAESAVSLDRRPSVPEAQTSGSVSGERRRSVSDGQTSGSVSVERRRSVSRAESSGRMLEQLLEKPVLAWSAADLHAGELFDVAEQELKRKSQQLKKEAEELRRKMQEVQEQLQGVQAEESVWRLRKRRYQELYEIRQQAINGVACDFWFLKASVIREREDLETLPAFQELRRIHPDWLERRSVSIKDAIDGSLVSETLVVSHRWEASDRPDPKGMQLKALRSHLKTEEGKRSKLVWYDYCCLPQGRSLTEDQEKELKNTLPNVCLLFLSGSVLLLVDGGFAGRFWTQLEAWLSMQSCVETGLQASEKDRKRHTIAMIHSEAEGYGAELIKKWSKASAEDALAALRAEDAKVTKQSDKKTQLDRLDSLNAFVAQEWSTCMAQVALS